MKLCIATHNPAKLAVYKKYIDPSIRIVSLEDLGINDDAPEDATDLTENALEKARFYFERTHMPTLSNDGGLMINGLHGEPGARSRRWPGHNATDEELIRMTLDKTSSLTGSDRDGTFGTVSVYKDANTEKIFEAHTDITIAQEANEKRIQGWPFRSVMIAKSLNKYFIDLSEEELRENDHNARVAKNLNAFLLKSQ